MDLGNPIEVIMHYLLIKGMTCLAHQDEFPMVSTSMYGYILNKAYGES